MINVSYSIVETHKSSTETFDNVATQKSLEASGTEQSVPFSFAETFLKQPKTLQNQYFPSILRSEFSIFN